MVNGTSQEGETVKFTADAEPGYVLDNVTLTNLSTNEVTVIEATRGGEMSFVMPASDVLVTATFSQSTAIESVKNAAQVTGVEYYNLAGVSSNKPFSGMNIIVTRYSDGTTTATKAVK